MEVDGGGIGYGAGEAVCYPGHSRENYVLGIYEQLLTPYGFHSYPFFPTFSLILSAFSLTIPSIRFLSFFLSLLLS